MTDAVICFTTTNQEKEAKAIAQDLVRERLAACVQLVPKITSYYMWDGAPQEDQEILLIIKTHGERLEELKEYISAHHSYEVPELVVLDVTDGLPEYLEWLEQITT